MKDYGTKLNSVYVYRKETQNQGLHCLCCCYYHGHKQTTTHNSTGLLSYSWAPKQCNCSVEFTFPQKFIKW